jgi:predicted nucleotidyltransferase
MERVMLSIDLERLFRSPGQISVLRALWRAPSPLTGRQVQRLAGVHNLTATQCLDDLENLGLLKRRVAGRAHLHSLKHAHRIVRYLIDPIFRAEEKVPQRFVRELGKVLEGSCLSAVLYGSVARGDQDDASDVDLLVVVKQGKAEEKFDEVIQAKAETLVRDGWSLMLEVNVKTCRELSGQWNSALIKRIRDEGLLIAGLPLEEVKRGSRV